jgi:hypothetical protein
MNDYENLLNEINKEYKILKWCEINIYSYTYYIA